MSDCPDCSSSMLPADDIDSEKANQICPECAPDFVLLRATTHTTVDINDQWGDKYQ